MNRRPRWTGKLIVLLPSSLYLNYTHSPAIIYDNPAAKIFLEFLGFHLLTFTMLNSMAVQLQKGKTKTKNYAANVDIHGENLEINTAFKLKTTKEKKNDRKFSQRKLQLSALRSPRSNCFLVLFNRRMKRNWAEKKVRNWVLPGSLSLSQRWKGLDIRFREVCQAHSVNSIHWLNIPTAKQIFHFLSLQNHPAQQSCKLLCHIHLR